MIASVLLIGCGTACGVAALGFAANYGAEKEWQQARWAMLAFIFAATFFFFTGYINAAKDFVLP